MFAPTLNGRDWELGGDHLRYVSGSVGGREHDEKK